MNTETTQGGEQMKLGYIDRVEARTIHVLTRHRQQNLFDGKETTTTYAKRFFGEITGMGNILVVKLQGSQYRTIGKRYL